MKEHTPDNYPRFLRVRDEDVTLKFVFDNIRNIGLAALLFALGIIIAKGSPISSLFFIPWSEVILGILICCGAFLLVVCNFIQGLLAILVTNKTNTLLYIVFSIILQAAVFEVFFKQVSKAFSS